MCVKQPTYHTGYVVAILYLHALHSFLLGTFLTLAITEMVLTSSERLALVTIWPDGRSLSIIGEAYRNKGNEHTLFSAET